MQPNNTTDGKSGKLVRGYYLMRAIARIVGIEDMSRVRSMTLEIQPTEIPRLHVEFFVDSRINNLLEGEIKNDYNSTQEISES